MCTLSLILVSVLLQADEPIALKRVDIEKLYDQARPHIEAVLEIPVGSFAWPRVRRVTDADFVELPDATVRKLVARCFPGLKEDHKMQSAAEMTLATVSVAKWCEQYPTIHIRATLDRATLESWTEWKPDGDRERTARAMIQLALVQEAIRAYLYQRYDLSQRLEECRDADEMLALFTVIEGRILWWTRKVAERMGTLSYVPIVVKRHKHGSDAACEPGLRRACQVVLARYYEASTKGLDFFDVLHQHGLQVEDRQVFNRPPTQWTWIERPMLYWNAERSHRPSLKKVLDFLSHDLPVEDWRVETQSWKPDMVRQVAQLYGQQKRADAILEYWDEACSLVWAGKSDTGRQVGLSVVRFENAARARAYHSFAIDLQRRQDEVISSTCNGTYCVSKSTSRSLNWRDTDEVICVEKRILLKTANGEVDLAIVLVRAGDTVAEVTWHGMPADLTWAEKEIGKLLDKIRVRE